MIRVVIDCSVAISWCFEDEANSYADSILKDIPNIEPCVPSLWQYEVANVFATAIRKKRISESKAHELTARLYTIPLVEITAVDVDNLVWLAHEQGISAYDAAYLSLAMEMRCELATLDNKLAEAASRCGVKLYKGGAR